MRRQGSFRSSSTTESIRNTARNIKHRVKETLRGRSASPEPPPAGTYAGVGGYGYGYGSHGQGSQYGSNGGTYTGSGAPGRGSGGAGRGYGGAGRGYGGAGRGQSGSYGQPQLENYPPAPQTPPPPPWRQADNADSLRYNAPVPAVNQTPAGSAVSLDAGSYAERGRKPWAPEQTGQDSHFLRRLHGGILVVGVFDGHGPEGGRAAELAVELFSQSASTLASLGPERLPDALRQLFLHSHSKFEGQAWAKHSGTTATLAIIDSAARTMTCAHVGDSTLILARGGRIMFQTTDHNFDAEDIARCAAHGAQVEESQTNLGPIRRVGGLAISRTLGDLDAHAMGVIAEPEIQQQLPVDAGSVLVVASDGVWNQLQKGTVLSIANTPGSSEAAARALVSESYPRWLQQGEYVDDITAVVVRPS